MISLGLRKAYPTRNGTLIDHGWKYPALKNASRFVVLQKIYHNGCNNK